MSMKAYYETVCVEARPEEFNWVARVYIPNPEYDPKNPQKDQPDVQAYTSFEERGTSTSKPAAKAEARAVAEELLAQKVKGE